MDNTPERIDGKCSPKAKAVTDVLRFEISPDEVTYKRITRNLREIILSKRLVPGTRLPPLMELAKLWNTNYFTVQTALTPLVNEGLLVRKQRTGTFVSEIDRKIKAVAIFFGANFLRENGFYPALYGTLCDYLEQMGIAVHLFIDSRPSSQQGTPFKPLIDAIKRSEVHGVIGAMLIPNLTQWLNRLPVPVSLFGSGNADFRTKDDHLIRSSLSRLKERGCRSVGIIGPKLDLNLTEKSNLEIRPEWIKQSSLPAKFEEFGYDALLQIWSCPSKPEGLIIYPDSLAKGAIMGILEQQIRVPEELKLVIHCNEEIYFHCPFPADWQVVRISTIAAELWRKLQSQIKGPTTTKAVVDFSLWPPSALSQPVTRRWSSNPLSIAGN